MTETLQWEKTRKTSTTLTTSDWSGMELSIISFVVVKLFSSMFDLCICFDMYIYVFVLVCTLSKWCELGKIAL